MPDNDAYEAIEYPCAGKTYSRPEYGVYRYSTYPEGSVLAGQERRSFLGSYKTEEEAKRNHPDAELSDASGYQPASIPGTPPEWFDPANAGESWDGE